MTDPLAALRPGDRVLVASGAGEPAPLVERLLARRHEIPDVELLLGYNLAGTVRPELVDPPRVTVFGGYGANRALLAAGAARVLPAHQSTLPGLIESGELGVDVVFLQCSPVGADGNHSLGVTADVALTAVARARAVVAEINDRMPRTHGDTALPASMITHAVHTSRPLAELPPSTPSALERRVAERVAELVPDRAVLQFGIGRVPEAVAALLRDHRDLGVHSGMLGDWLVDLVEAGAVTNAAKPIDAGVTVGGVLLGTRRLYDWADENAALSVRGSRYTHGAATLARLDTLVTVNGAIEVDLTGQVNAELIGDRYAGAIGGQVDYVRGGSTAPHGRSILAFTAMAGRHSRIVARLASGVVTTPRSDVDTVVTEHGVAHLRGRNLDERARLLAGIADPAMREDLLRAAAR
ncbi:MAG TPA: acetyl-CoA hydrolase/transferase C-terminal domain-containing protein [Actinophytocola sp.]|nr:acetyl-CoA hydrolase/transferase C-terminal domain-containing protein [Actinophytocola sp.]